MSFPAYEDTKESGVPWLGTIPLHWEVWQSRRLFSLRNERIRDGDEQLTASQEHGVIPQKMFMELEGRSVVQVILNAEILKHVEPSDFVISMRSFQGGIEFATHGGCISSAYVMLIPSPKIHGPFFKYLLKSDTYIQALQSTTNLVRDGQALRFQNFTMVDLPLVPLNEQKAISSFLDVETSKIDGLVSEQRLLIELLKEKRQAVISHAVTKGLNPNAPMKPSGIQWLGDVPQHWDVKKAKRVATVFVPQRNKPELNDSGNGVCWITMEQMQKSEIVNSQLFVSEESLANAGSKVLKSGAVIASCVGQFEVATINRVDVIINQQLQAYIPGPDINPEYLRLLILLSSSYFEQTGTAATIVYVNQKGFDELPVVVPPMGEQREIVDYLDVQLETFSELQAEAERAIELLQERRTALISAAVTGKIDVREAAYNWTFAKR